MKLLLIEDKLSNKRKATRGNQLNKEVRNILLQLVENKTILDIISEPKIRIPGYDISTFNPDIWIIVNKGHYIFIDNTTTIRTDRVKQKQWDAHGIKSAYSTESIKIECFVVVQNWQDIGNEKTRHKERRNVQREKEKIKNPKYFSELDAIYYVDELLNYLYGLNDDLFERAS